MSEPSMEPFHRPGLVRRSAAGAWHVPAGFAILVCNPRLWPLAVLPATLGVLLMFLGAVLGIFLIPRVEPHVAVTPGLHPVWVELLTSVLLWTAMIGAGVFLGLGLAMLLASPALERLSRRVEMRVRGTVVDSRRGFVWEIAQSLRGGFYFLLAAPGVFLLGLIPVLGPFLSALWGGRAVALQMTDPALTRRGLTLGERWRWHREWLAESEGFGLAGMIALLVPFANLLLGPALIAGGTLLVLSLEPLSSPTRSDGGPALPHDAKESPPPERREDAAAPGGAGACDEAGPATG